MTYGIPQGSLLGPLCFNLYINDLLTLKTEGDIGAYADDSRATMVGGTEQELYAKANRTFSLIQTWMQDNLLTLNLSKTTYIEFRNNPNQHLTITGISRSDSVKYLGVHIDSNLKWKEHVNQLTKKLRKSIYKFITLRPILNVDLMKTIYHAVFESHLRYGIVAWGSAFKNELEKLTLIQRRVLKIIYRRPRLYPTDMLYNEANVLNVSHTYL